MAKRYTRFYLVVIADYNDDDAHGIVHDNLFYWFDDHDLGIVEYDRVDVAAFNTVETGYVLARRALNPLSASRRQVFFVNTAPRMDEPGKRATNQGEAFVWTELKNGKHVFAVNSGYALSFIKPEIAALRALNVPPSPTDIPVLVNALAAGRGSSADNVGVGQFRSGYVYPIVVALALSGSNDPISPQFRSLVGEELAIDDIPDIPHDTIVFRDGYGNLKTSLLPAPVLASIDKLALVQCREAEIVAHVRPAIFDVPLHNFSMAPGSTVLAYSDGSRRQFVEIALRGGHAAKELAQPHSKDRVSLPIPGDPIGWRIADNEALQRLGYSADGTPPRSVLERALRP